jgi:hypothetical protein
MKKILFGLIFLATAFTVNAQDTSKNIKIQYIVDNVPIIDDPDEASGTLNNTDVAELTVVTDKGAIEKMGYKGADKIISITTKEFK